MLWSGIFILIGGLIENFRWRKKADTSDPVRSGKERFYVYRGNSKGSL